MHTLMLLNDNIYKLVCLSGRWAVEAAVREGHEAAVLPARPLDLQQHRAAREAVGGAVFPERGTDDDTVHELPAATRSGGRRYVINKRRTVLFLPLDLHAKRQFPQKEQGHR